MTSVRPRVALVTSRELADLDVDDRVLVGALQAAGADPVPTVWDDPEVDWSGFDIAVIRSAWDYTERRDHFVSWARQAASATRLHNPAPVVAWNTDKVYLARLAEAGVPVVPTELVRRGSGTDLATLLDRHGWEDVVVKPTVSAGARGTARFAGGDPAAQEHLAELLVSGDALVQPYVRAVETEGEVSVLAIAGRFSHAVVKRPAAGDFRVQVHHGGTFAPRELTPELTAAAAAVLDAAGAADLLYARVDLVRGDDPGGWQLVELEVVEPSLFLRTAPSAAADLAAAIVARADLPPGAAA